MHLIEDTIAAIATAPGSGGIAVLRISGPDAIKIADVLFRGHIKLKEAKSGRVYVGKIFSIGDGESNALDDAVVTVFRRPHSYTKEDTVEISCHGGTYLSARILHQLVQAGARLAERGEFTQRAFLNGRFDLSQAEAVADIIAAKTSASLVSAVDQYSGSFSKRIREIRAKVIAVCSLIELELDFAEEDIEISDRNELLDKFNQLLAEIDFLRASYESGRILREGAKLVIVGRPNVGKSSLLNALLKEDRAIVTEIAGTTRDVLEEEIDIRGVLFRIMDTAGVRSSEDRIEQIGVRKTLEQLTQADVVIIMFDGTVPLEDSDEQVVETVFRKCGPSAAAIGVINKCDRVCLLQPEQLKKRFGLDSVVEISALELTNLAELENELLRKVALDNIRDEPFVTNLRQKIALDEGSAALRRATASLRQGLPGELVAADLRGTSQALGEIIGDVCSEDILDSIFSKFCIGK